MKSARKCGREVRKVIGYPLAIQRHPYDLSARRNPCKVGALGEIRTPNLLIRSEGQLRTTGATSTRSGQITGLPLHHKRHTHHE